MTHRRMTLQRLQEIKARNSRGVIYGSDLEEVTMALEAAWAPIIAEGKLEGEITACMGCDRTDLEAPWCPEHRQEHVRIDEMRRALWEQINGA